MPFSVFLLIGMLNMSVGTGSFICYTLMLRKNIHMSSMSLMFYVGFAIIHYLFYLLAGIVYMTYTDTEVPVEEIYVFEKEDPKPKK